jgi:hypothetical protein
MAKPVFVATYIEDNTFEVAVSSRFGPVIVERFSNTAEGIEAFAKWAEPHIKDQDVRWVATIPKGDGGIAYSWFYDNTGDIFLQNPTRLKEYAEREKLPWQSAETLHRFNVSKVWT